MKLKIILKSAYTTLMPALCNQQPPTHLLDQVCGLENHLLAPHHFLTNLTPINLGLTLPPLKQLTGIQINVGMISIVVGEFCKRKMHIPTPTQIKKPKF